MRGNASGGPSRSGKEILPLTGVRALAAWSVVLFHISETMAQVWPRTAAAVSHGWLGVDLFFILSGFVIALNYWDQVQTLGEYGRFVWMRLARLYPVHLVTLFGALAIFAGGTAMRMQVAIVSRYTVASFAENLFLVHHWWLAPFSWNSPAWSVSCEFLAYLVFPLFVFGWKGQGWTGKILGIIWIAPFVCLALAASYSTDGLVRIGFEFPAGCFLFILYKRASWLARHGGLLVSLALASVLPMLYWRLPAIWMVAAMPVLVLGLAFDQGWFAWLLRTRGPVFWGRASYSLYMTHNLMLSVLQRILPLHGLRMLPVWIVTMGAVAVATYYGVEKPGRRLMQRNQPRLGWFPKKSPVPAPTVPVSTDLDSSTELLS